MDLVMGHSNTTNMTSIAVGNPQNLTLVAVETRAEDHYEHQVRQHLVLYVSPVVIILGSLGNLMSFIVLQTKNFRTSSIGFVLSALAVVDTCLLNTGLLRQWILALSPGLDVRAFSSAGCKIHVFLTYFLAHMSSWTLVILTIERGLSVMFPLKARYLCSKLRIISAWCVVAVIMAALNAHIFWTFELFQYKTRTGIVITYCYIESKYRAFWGGSWSWLDFCFLSFLPSAIIFAGNLLIIHTVIKARALRRQCSSVQRHDPSDKTARSTTAMLIAISIVFLLLTLPNVIYLIGSSRWTEAAKKAGNKRKLAQLGLVYAVTNLLYYLNSAINFALYCLTGSQFRRALKSLFVKVDERSSRRSISTKQSLLMTAVTPSTNMGKPVFPQQRVQQ